MDVLIVAAGVCLVLLCALLLVLCIIVSKLIRRMPEAKREAVITTLYGVAESVWYGVHDGKLEESELRSIMASILSAISALSGVSFKEIEKEFSEEASDEETDAYFLSITDENIIPKFQQYSNDELFVKEDVSFKAGASYFYGIISAPKNARLTLSARSKYQDSPDWNYIPTDENASEIVRIPFRIMYPSGGWKRGQYKVYFSLMDDTQDVVYDHVGVTVTVS